MGIYLAETIMENWFETLRKKWTEIPGDNSTRYKTTKLKDLNDNELLELWKKTLEKDTTLDRFNVRGWYHLLYKDVFKGKNIVDVGSGFGMDALSFAMAGANVTCADICKENLHIIQRLSLILGVSNIKFVYLEDLASFDKIEYELDAVYCQGSLINAPYDLTRAEVQELIKHLKNNGRFIELAYPKERWIREGSMPFELWGEKTDGKGTPYMEWYDLEKVKSLFHPTQVDIVLSFNFCNNDFNWFDLVVRKNESTTN